MFLRMALETVSYMYLSRHTHPLTINTQLSTELAQADWDLLGSQTT